MTQFGKCDICRLRKVKCDEQRPSCGQCRKKNRPCGYDYAKTIRFSYELDDEPSLNSTELALRNRALDPVFDGSGNKDLTSDAMTLRIRSVKEAKEGRGVFHTFNTVLKPGRRMRARDPSKKEHSRHLPASIPRPILSRDMYLSFDFIELLGEEALKWNSTFLWGCWISQVPERLGRNAALDDAADCFIAGHTVIYSEGSNENAMAIASAKYTTALGSLQKALYADDEVRYSTETLAAVNLLLLYDEIIAFRELRWQAHCKGLIQLLFARGPQCMTEDMSRSLFYAALTHDFSEAVLHGRVSTFDSEEWLNFPPPQHQWNACMDFTGSDEITRHFIQLPRLITLVRQVRENPPDVDVSNEAVALAEHLYCSYANIIAPRVDAAFLGERVRWVETVDESLARYYPESLDFQSFNDFEAFVRYCFVRVLVLNLCMVLRAILPFSPILDMASLEEEEERCTMLIIASVQYAETQDPVSMGALIVQLPMQVAYGAWWRKRGGIEPNTTWETERAIFMEHWCYEKTNAFIKVLNGDPIAESKIQVMYMSAAEAGPYMMGCKRQTPLTKIN